MMQRLLRPRETAHALTVSESHVAKLEKAGLLTPIRIPGMRSKRFAADEVGALAERWISRAKEETAEPTMA